ncbi:D-xylose ABC transporter substrate-binding protein, partial [Staphylococcus shinii]
MELRIRRLLTMFVMLALFFVALGCEKIDPSLQAEGKPVQNTSLLQDEEAMSKEEKIKIGFSMDT